MEASARTLLVVCVLCAATLRTGFGLHTVNAVYGETIMIPCGHEIVDDLLFASWKYETPDGTAVFLASRSAVKNKITYGDAVEYKTRLELSENYTLSISNAVIDDEKRFVCMLVTADNVFEEPTVVRVFKPPSKPEILEQPKIMETGKINRVGVCVAKDSYPDGNITWYRNGMILLPVDGAVIIEWNREKNSSSGLYSMQSSLQYMATKEDIRAFFRCTVTYFMPNGQVSAESDTASFDIYYPTEKVTIQIQPSKKYIKEGDNITIQCKGNGNPPPQEFLYYLPGQEEGIVSSSAYHITDIKRNATGDYKCSLSDKNMMASATVTVHYLDLSLTPSGEVTKQIGDTFSVLCVPFASKNVSVMFMKDSKILTALPFKNLQYRDSGVYECLANLEEEGLQSRKTFKLTVEGKPKLKLTKNTSSDGKTKTISYEVEGFPKPEVSCSGTGNLNKTEETVISNIRYSAKIIISPEENTTVICVAENRLGKEVRSLNVSANDSSDHAKLIVGIVVGLLLAALIAGAAYCIYSRKSSSATKHVGKELGNTEENKKLEENNHKSDA
ncbi:activated leukocyte cell adhesion molecule S homeolog isoform X1 [Xenopus laevis]|uniref:Activated leukocyte cell adhesion molecule S homeolog isoform X1 n=1 Tax=Xenopus laevis TaxID=8355 RepID=A0A8J1MBW4_XENLA|nr:activated leukocyte cell adhesion molecule S homeolog isoform X1 [Xenopus laevis]